MDLIFDRTFIMNSFICAFMNMTAGQVQHSTYTHNNFYHSLCTMGLIFENYPQHSLKNTHHSSGMYQISLNINDVLLLVSYFILQYSD